MIQLESFREHVTLIFRSGKESKSIWSEIVLHVHSVSLALNISVVLSDCTLNWT